MSDCYRDARDPREIFRYFFSDIDGFTVEPSVQCDIQVLENIFVDDPK